MAKVCLAVDVGKKSSCYALYRAVDITAGSEGMETLIGPHHHRKVCRQVGSGIASSLTL